MHVNRGRNCNRVVIGLTDCVFLLHRAISSYGQKMRRTMIGRQAGSYSQTAYSPELINISSHYVTRKFVDAGILVQPCQSRNSQTGLYVFMCHRLEVYVFPCV